MPVLVTRNTTERPKASAQAMRGSLEPMRPQLPAGFSAWPAIRRPTGGWHSRAIPTATVGLQAHRRSVGSRSAGFACNPALNSNQWHAAIVGDLSVRQVVENVVNNNAWFPAVLAPAPGISGAGMRHGRVFRHLGGRRTTLLDYSAGSVEFCRKVFAQAGLPGNFVQADVCRTLPFADDAFDCTWSSGLLEHFTDEQLLFILKESARVSRRCVVSLVPNARSIFYRLGKWYQEQHGLWAWGKEDPKRTMKSFFEAAGLVDVREFTIDVKTAIAFVHPIRAKMLRKSLLLLSRLLPEAGWRFLNQGYLLVTIGQKPETIRHHRDGGGRKLDFSDGIGIVT